ncbi:MAG: glycosyltransferase family 39 protein [Stenomitos rutilans HA7619-LM2]|nr:glycosyltransferase family 39 protein [Stenomitos rutilans HA7619-LM2]
MSIALLVLAVCFRVIHLDRKVYWHDEAYTSMVITARPGNYLSRGLFQNTVVKPADLLAYQHFVPTLSLTDMIARKGVEDAQHPPLYYILLRFWAEVWGTSPTVTRGFTALLSLLLFPAVYWFCVELFESSLVGWIAIALFAVSPFQLVYAQEAREYGLWTILSLASSTLLLQAIRSPSWRNWVLYGVSMVTTLYTALFAVWLAVGHFFYLLVVDEGNQLMKLPWRLGKRTVLFVITLLVVGLLFMPWAYFVTTSGGLLESSTSWITVPLPLIDSIQSTIFNFSRSFVDFNFELSNPVAYGFAIPVLMLQGYAIFVLCRHASRRIWWFMLTFVGSTALAFGLPDLLSGGQRFTVTRYIIPCFVGLQIAVAYLLAIYLTRLQRWKMQAATLVFSLLLTMGVASSSVYIQSNTWWNKVLNANYEQVAAIVNGSDRPLIVTDAFGYNPASMISLSYLLKPDAQFLLLPPVGNAFSLKTLPQDAHNIFLMNLPEVFRRQFIAKYQRSLTPIFQDSWNELWKVQ